MTQRTATVGSPHRWRNCVTVEDDAFEMLQVAQALIDDRARLLAEIKRLKGNVSAGYPRSIVGVGSTAEVRDVRPTDLGESRKRAPSMTPATTRSR